MEEQWVVDRGQLRQLMREYPGWSHRKMSEATGRSVGWVRKWRSRLALANNNVDVEVLQSESRARHTTCKLVCKVVVEQILELRERASEVLGRMAGPLAILYYLHREADLLEQKVYLPRSTSTIWRILDEHQRILRRCKIEHCPVERPEPMTVWQMDFKDITTARSETSDKKQHQVEALNLVDAGTSIVVDSIPRDDFNAETTLETLARVFLVEGLPRTLTFDRDPRFINSWSGDDFPSALVRFLGCLGVKPDVLPPDRPDLNPFVERFNRSFKEECIQRYHPATLEHACHVVSHFKWLYNTQRPNQSSACGNQPPYAAFPQLPIRPRLPDIVDPDAWLGLLHGEVFKRRVNPNGSIQIGRQHYYVQHHLRGRQALIQVDAHNRLMIITCGNDFAKERLIKGLHDATMDFQSYLSLIMAEARSEWRQLKHSKFKSLRNSYYADVF